MRGGRGQTSSSALFVRIRVSHLAGTEPVRIAVIGSGKVDSLPHNGAVVTLLAVCGSSQSKSYFDMVMANIVARSWLWWP